MDVLLKYVLLVAVLIMLRKFVLYRYAHFRNEMYNANRSTIAEIVIYLLT